MRPFGTLLVVVILSTGAFGAVAAQTATPQTAAVCVQRPFQQAAHLDVVVSDNGFGHATFSIRLPNATAKIQQIGVRLGPAAGSGGFLLLNLVASIQLNNITIEHAVDVPNTPFMRSGVSAATMSRQVTFYADAGSVAVLQADFNALPPDTAGVDVSIVGLTRSGGCLATVGE